MKEEIVESFKRYFRQLLDQGRTLMYSDPTYREILDALLNAGGDFNELKKAEDGVVNEYYSSRRNHSGAK